MLASGAAYAHEVLVGNVMPLAPDQLKESITCVIPLNLPGSFRMIRLDLGPPPASTPAAAAKDGKKKTAK